MSYDIKKQTQQKKLKKEEQQKAAPKNSSPIFETIEPIAPESNMSADSPSIITSTPDKKLPFDEPTAVEATDATQIVGETKPSEDTQSVTEAPSTVEEPKKGYNEYAALQKQYIEQYLGRGEFEYDEDADELYQKYRDQALMSAERARRDTVAQAAGLTGGYGSSYASAMGTAAYNDIIEDADAMLPEFYEAAKQKWDEEGERLLSDASLAGQYAQMLYQESPEYQLAVAALDNEEAYAIEQSLKTTKGIYDFEGKNDTGATWYDEAMRIYAGVATGTNRNVEEKHLGEHKNYTEAEIRNDLMTWEDAEGNHMSREQVDYLVNEIMGRREIAYISALESADGVKLLDYVSSLADSGISGEELYDKLSAFTDKSGKKLTSEQIIILMTSI